jgi:hypothetical protein
MTAPGRGEWKVSVQSPSANSDPGEPHIGYSRFSSREEALKYAAERRAGHKVIRLEGPNGVSMEENEIESEIKKRFANWPSAA